MKGIVIFEKEKDRIFLPEQFLQECREKQVLIIYEPLEVETKIREEFLYIVASEEAAGYLSNNGAAVLGYRDRMQSFPNLKWVLEPAEDDSDLSLSYLEQVYRRYKKLPWDILETEHLLVRETTVEDVEAFYRIYSEPSITRYTENLFEDPAMGRAYTENYRDKIYSLYGFGMWTVVEKASDLVIGRAGISMRDGYEEPELGFIIGVPWQRKGYAYEVCSAILKYAKEELDFEKVISFVMEENKASLALCRKLGFVLDGVVTLERVAYLQFSKDL